jgi:inward rectifier potassium channel
MYDLRLFRDRSQALGRSWQVLHALDENSPLRGMSEESVRGQDMEIDVLVTGLDGTSSQNIHGRHVYLPEDLRFGYRYVDMLRSKPDGRLELDFSKLHAIMPVR